MRLMTVITTVEALLQLGDSQNPDANDQHIVKLVDWILQFAFEQSASDIHMEPRKDNGKVRFRIDGVLHTIYNMPSNTLTAVISRIKILGRLNVAEKRKPQDGRLKHVRRKDKKPNYVYLPYQQRLVKNWLCVF